jgi:hypothetical protein
VILAAVLLLLSVYLDLDAAGPPGPGSRGRPREMRADYHVLVLPGRTSRRMLSRKPGRTSRRLLTPDS